METRRDFWVGLFVVAVLGVISVTLLVTSGLGEVHYNLYMRTESALELTSDTRVFLQGLEIGRVRELNPVQDSASGTLSFVARLSIRQKFPDGKPVRLPAGTTALVTQSSSNPLSPLVVQFVVPRVIARGAYLAGGDTIGSTRAVNAMDRLGDVADRLSTEVENALGETRRLLAGTNRAVARTDSLLVLSRPQIDRSLQQLAASLERADRTLASLEPKVGPVTDSLTATLADTRRVLQRLDELATNANGMATENRDALRQTIDHLLRSSVVMDHFVEQVSRRPMRMLTGVKAPAPKKDSVTASSNGGVTGAVVRP